MPHITFFIYPPSIRTLPKISASVKVAQALYNPKYAVLKFLVAKVAEIIWSKRSPASTASISDSCFFEAFKHSEKTL